MSIEALTRLSYCLLAVGCLGFMTAAGLYRGLELSKAWHILFDVPLPQKRNRRETPKKPKNSVVEPTQRLVVEETVVLHGESRQEGHTA